MYKYIFIFLAVVVVAGCGNAPKENSIQSANRIGTSALSALEKVEGAMDYTEETAKDVAQNSQKIINDVAENVVTKEITLVELAKHASKDDCWLAVNARVYDVTPFIAQGAHPGKEAILVGCGKDATMLFESRPMGSVTPHSKKAHTMLAQYEIGLLAQ